MRIQQTIALCKNNIKLESIEFKPDNLVIPPPELVEITLHNTCNYRCKMCYFWQTKTKDFIPIDLLFKAFDDVHKLNTVNPKIQLLGGETLMYPNLDQAISYASKRGIKIEIVTNGFFLNKTMAIRLGNAGLSALTISLDSIDKKTHNYLRGVDCYDKVMRAVENMINYASNVRLNINTIISSINMHTLLDNAKFVKNKKGIASLYYIVLEKPYNSSYGTNWRTKSPVSYLWPTNHKKINEVFDSLIEEKKLNEKIGNSIGQFEVYRKYYHNYEQAAKSNGCDFGTHHVRINQEGNVYLCSERHDIASIGSIKSKSFSDIWKSKQALRTRDIMSNCKKNCVQILSCGYKDE